MIARKHLAPHDIVAVKGEAFPKGEVQAKLGAGFVAVKWPSGLWTREHQSTLWRIV